MDNVIYTGICFAVTVVAFLAGKYIFPKIPQDVKEKLATLSTWAADFVVWAKEFMKSSSGEEKMAAVVEKLEEVAKEMGWTVTEDQLKAIAQSAYNAMKAGEKEQQTAATPLEAVTVPAAPAATVIINTSAAEKVAVATDNVPEDALKHNADGSVNVYDNDGNKVGTITEEEAEAAASDVTMIVEE